MNQENLFSGGSRAPYVPQYGAADFPFILREAGLDIHKYGQRDFLMQGGLGALYELFSDRELIAHDPNRPIKDNQLTPEIRHGEFYARLAELRERVRSNLGSKLDIELNKLARFAGIVYAEEAERGLLPMGGGSEVKVESVQIPPVIDYAGRSFPINNGSIILDIGPGIAGRLFVELQAKMLLQGQMFQYLAISDGPFVNEFLLEHGRKIFIKNPRLNGLFDLYTKRGFFVGREDGFSRAMDELLSTPQPSGRHDFVNIAICNGLGNADKRELEEGLGRIHEVLMQGGYLLLGSPVEREQEGNLSFAEQLALVSNNFEVESQLTRESGLAVVGRNTTSTFAVLRKK